MVDKEYRRAMDQLALDESFRQRLVTAMTEETPRRRRAGRLLCTALIAAAVAVLMVTVALAVSPTFRDIILTSLGFRAPYATEALASCEDQGITIEAQKALTDGRVTRLYFTVHDPSGVFFLSDTQNQIYMDYLVNEEEFPAHWDYRSIGEGLERLAYDEETQTALYILRGGIITGGEVEESPIPTHAKLSMERYLPGVRGCNVTYHGPMSRSKRQDRLITPVDILESTEENGTVVLLPEQNPQSLGDDCPEVYISSMGFASDGYYHIRLHQESNVTQTWNDDVSFREAFEVLYLLSDENGNATQYDWDGTISTPVSDGWDYCLTVLTQENFENLYLLSIDASYSVSGGFVMGDWSLTIPVSPVECRTAQPKETLILSATKDSPPPSGESHEAQVSSVSVSTISVVADFVRPENYHLCADVQGRETACAVTFADGTVLEPAYFAETWSGNGWVMWEFDEEIDPSEVVSVSLNGNEIPFSSE